MASLMDLEFDRDNLVVELVGKLVALDRSLALSQILILLSPK